MRNLILLRHSIFSISALLAVAFILTPSVPAQDKQYTENKPDQALRSETRVDPSTLGMSLEIPLGGATGRAGSSLPIALRYSSKQWRINFSMTWWSYVQPHTWTRAKFSESSIAGWSNSLEPPRIEFTGIGQLFDRDGNPLNEDPDNPADYVNYVRRIHVHLSDGSSHELRKDDDPVRFYPDQPNYDFSGVFYAVDGSNMRYDNDAGVLYMPDGGRYFFGAQQVQYRYQGEAQDGRWATSYIDRNGNTLTYDPANRVWTDTLGRTYGQPLPDDPVVGYQTYNVPGVGQTLTYTLHWTRLADVLSNPAEQLRYTSNTRCVSPTQYESRSPYLFNSSSPSHICADNDLFNPIVLAEVTLPNGTAYQLRYNPWGEIDKVVYPTGGYERFRYDQVPTIAETTEPYDQGNRGVVERWVSPSGTGSEESTHHWQYSATRSATLTATSTLPNGTRSERLAHVSSTIAYFGFDNPLAGMTYDERIFNSINQMLRRTLTEWSLQTPAGSSRQRNPHVTKNVSLLLDTGGNALAAGATMQYDGDLNVTTTNRYDYAEVDAGTAQTGAIGSIPFGPLVRTEEATYLVNDTTIDAGVRQAYRARQLLGLPSSTRVKNAAGTIVAQGEIKYDEAAYPLLTYGAVTGWNDPGTTVRGNATTARSWLNTTGGWLESHVQYDQCGSVRNAWDAKGNQSQIEYSSSYYYAYPTLTRTPVPDPNGQYGSNTAFVSTSVYDFSTGLLTSTTDPNNVTSTFEYNDSLNHLTRTVRASGTDIQSQTYVAYDYANHLITTTSDQSSYNDNVLKSQAIYDGLGRTTETRQYEGGTNYIAAQTQYDNMGRPYKTSNPFRPWNSETAIWTTMGFDALSRVTSVTTADNGVVTTSYDANFTTVTDQAGRVRRSMIDGLGRLIRVDEPDKDSGQLGAITTPVQPTCYEYDVLGNLIKVIQGTQLDPATGTCALMGSQQRTFSYDSLARLRTAVNPESGTISYNYDDNGNLTQKIDPRLLSDNQTHITTIYAYDSLNRVISRSYNDGSPPNYADRTPAVTYTYDTLTNGKGRLSSVSSSVSTYAYNSYDALGRVRGATQTIGAQSYPITNINYDLAGHLKTMTYPSGHFVTYNYDSAGRLADKDPENLAFTGNLGQGGSPRTYASGLSYSSFGGLQEEKFGTQTPIYHKQRYNSRGQLWDMRASTVPFASDPANGDRGAIVNYYSNNFVQGGSGTDNNGNLLRQENYIPGSSFFQDNFTYDALNRLTSIGEKLNGTGTNTFSQTYSYDRWGNRTISGVTGTGINSLAFEVENGTNGTNRLYAPGDLALPETSRQMQYDPAGNLKKDTYSGAAVTRLYDAENKMTKETQAGNDDAGIYSYDGDGRRVKRKVNGVETWQVYGLGGELIAEYAENAPYSSPQKEYGYRNGELLITATVTTGSGGSAFTFTDDPVVAETTTVKALHVTELRTAVNQARARANLSSATWTDDPVQATVTAIKAVHITELRARLDEARAALGLSAANYTDPTLISGYQIKAAHVQELRTKTNEALTTGAGTSLDIRWLVADQLGTPRMIFDQSGSLENMSRHDYLPFGEEVPGDFRTGIPGYGASDNVRQKFTQKERDNETGLDYFLARYYSSRQGRFTSPDPLYFQAMMAIDPQRFNLYAYTRNNPLKFIDPSGENLHLRGNDEWLRTNVLYEMAGGQENFDRYFEIADGQVIVRSGVDTSGANAGVQELLALVNATQNYLYFAGTDGDAVADLFQGSRDDRGRLNSNGRRISDEFTGSGGRVEAGSVVGTQGRPGSDDPANLANGDPVFAVIAYNTNAVFTQDQISYAYLGSDEMLYNAPVAFYAQSGGLRQVIRPVSFFIHESAENLEFARIGASNANYGQAHTHAMRREAQIRDELNITGGFSGGHVQRRVPRR